MTYPLILDFDQSVLSIPESKIIDLSSWQDSIRFGCSQKVFNQLNNYLEDVTPLNYGTVFLGSGDYHHISTLLINRLFNQVNKPFQVVVFDNHPDNMRFPFGIHCGSWIAHIARMPFVSKIHVLGITSSDIGLSHAWENYLKPLYSGKLTYWCTGVNTRWAHFIGLGHAFRHFSSTEALIETFLQEQSLQTDPVYLSIDKDVLSVDVVRTNWDQGCLTDAQLLQAIDYLRPRVIGSDITGEVSVWQYKHRWKRFLSQLDQQPELSKTEIESWQRNQNNLNLRILSALIMK